LEQFVADHLSGLVSLLAGVALQIYLLHDFILRQDSLHSIAFPANLIVFWMATITLSVVFERITLRRQTKIRPAQGLVSTQLGEAKDSRRLSSEFKRAS
jgi:hypothetical protein